MRAVDLTTSNFIDVLRVFSVVLCLRVADVRSTIIERTLSYGAIEGRLLTTRANNSAFAFLGVPFAQRPTADLRFRKPQQLSPWSGKLNCTSEKAGCIGDDTKDSQSEDCLYLDILQPEQCEEESTSCAVFAYLHSDLTTDVDSFIDNFVRESVVVVLISHRQGALGFLNLPSSDNDYDKNVGIYDLLLALRFVNEEIKCFGGNNSRVTIGGHGVGAELVGYLTLSPMAKGLFSKAMALSGAPEMQHKLASDANVDSSQKLVESNKCLHDTVDCLRKLSAETFSTNDYFGPTIDGDIFVSNVAELRKTRLAMPYLIGVASKHFSRNVSTEQSCRKAAASLDLTSNVVVEKCKQHYDNSGESPIFDATNILLILKEAASMAQLSNQTYLYSIVDFSDPYETYTDASRIFTQLQTNFIKHGEPGGGWRPLNAVELNYLQLSASNATTKSTVLFHWDAVKFWKNTAPSLKEGYEFKRSENKFDYETAFWVAVCAAVVLFMGLCVRTMLACCANRRRQSADRYRAIESDDNFHEGDSR